MSTLSQIYIIFHYFHTFLKDEVINCYSLTVLLPYCHPFNVSTVSQLTMHCFLL